MHAIKSENMANFCAVEESRDTRTDKENGKTPPD